MERGGDRRREEEEVPVNITSFIALFLPSVPFRTPHPQSQPPSDTIHELFLRAMTKEQTLTQKQPRVISVCFSLVVLINFMCVCLCERKKSKKSKKHREPELQFDLR